MLTIITPDAGALILTGGIPSGFAAAPVFIETMLTDIGDLTKRISDLKDAQPGRRISRQKGHRR